MRAQSAGSRTRLRRWTAAARRGAALLLILAIAGCYETKYEAFDREAGVAVPGLEGRYAVRFMDTWAHYTVWRTGRSNDYQFEQDESGREASSGTLRAIDAGNGLYIAQLMPLTHGRKPAPKDRGRVTYSVIRVMRSKGVIAEIDQLEPDAGGENETHDRIWAIARRDATDIWDLGFGQRGLSGSPAALRRFLFNMSAVPLKTKTIFKRLP
jgi:hypothetical protein